MSLKANSAQSDTPENAEIQDEPTEATEKSVPAVEDDNKDSKVMPEIQPEKEVKKLEDAARAVEVIEVDAGENQSENPTEKEYNFST